MVDEEKTPLLQSETSFSNHQADIQIPTATRPGSRSSIGRGARTPLLVDADAADYYVPPDKEEIVIEQIRDYGNTTNMQAAMHLIKGMVGTGILSMPLAFRNGGLWVSFATLFFVGSVCVYCMNMLVVCSEILCRRLALPTLDYAGVMEKCFESGPKSLQKYSLPSRRVVNAFLIITQFGFACIYLLFVAQNINEVVDHFHPGILDPKVYTTVVMVLLIPYVMIKNLKALAPFSTFANLLNVAGLGIIFVNLWIDMPNVNDRPVAAPDIITLPLAFGQFVFSFEGIGLVLPIQNKMKTKQDLPGWTGVLILSCVITMCLYEAMGFYGYLKYGEETKGSITLNLGETPLFLAVKVMFAASLFISYGLQFYVPVIIIWAYVQKKLDQKQLESRSKLDYKRVAKYSEVVFRIVMVLVTYAIAIAVPDLGLLISLLGAFASTALALIFPPIIELVTYAAENGGLSWWLIIKNIFIFVFGFVGFATGTFSSIRSIIDKFG